MEFRTCKTEFKVKFRTVRDEEKELVHSDIVVSLEYTLLYNIYPLKATSCLS